MITNTRLLPVVALLFFVATLPLTAQPLTDTLTVTTASPFADFGASVAQSGPVILVGAPDDAVPANYTGSVYVFRKTPTGWVEEAKLTGSRGALHDRFGRSLAIGGNVAVIGAPAPLSRTNTTGYAYVFRYDGTKWNEEAVLAAGQWFGTSVAIDGNRIAVGAPYTRVGSQRKAGAVYLYRRVGNNWVLEQQLTTSDAYDSDLFGWSVAVEGTHLLAGAQYEGDAHLQKYVIGAVYHFELSGSTWVERQKIRASNFAEQSYFGRTLAMDGNVAVVGSPGKKVEGIWGAGTAYVLRRGTSGWVEEEKLRSPWPAVQKAFGQAVAVDGGVILVSDAHRDGAGNIGGAVHPYRWDGNKWSGEPPFRPAGLSSQATFGQCLALEGARALVGAWFDAIPPVSDGAAFVYDVTPWAHLMTEPLPLASNDDAKLRVRYGLPKSTTFMFVSLSGPTQIPLPWPGVTLGLSNPVVIGIQQAGQGGDARWDLPLPAALSGVRVWLQAGQVSSPQVALTTNVLDVKIE